MLTPAAGETRLASALESVHLVLAGAAVAAWVGRALVLVHLARSARPAGVADALEREQAIYANAILAWILSAHVHLGLAALAGEAGWTLATEVVQQVGTLGTKQTGAFSAIVYAKREVKIIILTGRVGKLLSTIAMRYSI
jgi:hypothetical protein